MATAGKNRRGWIHVWLSVVALLFAAACCLPAFVDDEWGVFFGYECLIAFPLAMAHPAWHANVFLLAGVIVTAFGSDRNVVVVIAVLACGLALLYPPWSPGVLIGYWVWLSAFVAFLAGSIASEAAGLTSERVDGEPAGA